MYQVVLLIVNLPEIKPYWFLAEKTIFFHVAGNVISDYLCHAFADYYC